MVQKENIPVKTTGFLLTSCSSYQTESHNLASVTVWSENGPQYHWLQIL